MRKLLAGFVLSLAVLLAPLSAAGGPLVTAIGGEGAFEGPQASVAFAHTKKAGAGVVRLSLNWRDVAPAGTTKPAGFNPTNPGDPLYRWSAFDREVRLAHAQGLDVIASVQSAPAWASQVNLNQERFPGFGPLRPDAVEFGRFAAAAAKRYGGRFQGLPRIRYWQAWNEPNTTAELVPQLDGTKLVSPGMYRTMLNNFAVAVHAVHRDNLVIAGGLAPFTIEVGATAAVGPLRFMRALLCMSGGAHPRPTCNARARFDVWSTHPYTSGGPTHHASNPDDVSLGDLGKVRALLTAAQRAHRIVSAHAVKFWVTEFSWDTDPPDTYHTVPMKLHARWVAEALYRMWASGVSLVAWYLLRDQAWPADPAQSGLYFRGATVSADRPKLSLTAFRFPFVAFKQNARIFVWGRTPASAPANVVVERGRGKQWTRLGLLRADRYGIFTARLRAAGSGTLVRARLANGKGAALAFSLVRPPDRYVLPFGGGGGGGGG